MKPDMTAGRFYRIFLSFLVIAAFSGCSGIHPSPPEEGLVPPAGDEAGEYRLRPGDVVNVKFFYNPELNELLPIRPDGKISLQLVDDVQAAGLTPPELDRVLTEKYAAVLHEPEIVVIVKEFGSQKVYVGGEVRTPGIVPLAARMTALQAIFYAGGFRETAQPSSVILIRRGEDGRPAVRAVNLSDVISGKAPGSDPVLSAFDVVFVPKTFIAKANRFVEQYIRQMIPATLSAGFSYTLFKEVDKDQVPVIGQ
jgi:polysaccharide export outer membrane protein